MINSPSFWDKLKEELRAVTKEVRSFTTDVDNTIRVALHTGKILTFNLPHDVTDEQAIEVVKDGVMQTMEVVPSPEVVVSEPVSDAPADSFEEPALTEPDVIPAVEPLT